jgi:diguanylate cyclase (GGDEF)-like protein/PAS domain S-box-containing protein
MDNKLVKFASETNEMLETGKQDIANSKPWQVLIVDDDQGIHDVTRLVLSNFSFENKPLKLFFAYSATEARELLEQPNEFSVLLLDVVMETDHAGLDLVSYIRNVIKNQFLRIILRTGQPGMAPELSVIVDYDINDYRTKTELTSEKLYSCITAALRSYRDINTIHKLATAREKLQKKVAKRNGELEKINIQLKHEIEERFIVEELLASTNDKLESIINNSTALISLKDTAGRYDLVNKVFSKCIDITGDNIIGKTDHEIFSNETASMIRMNDLEVFNMGQAIQCEEILPTQGEEHFYLCVKFPLYSSDGEIYRICSICTDITERLEAQNKILHLAQYDALTGLPNRLLFIDRLTQSLSRAEWDKHQLAVMFIDLDRFKLINDTLGHDVGDKLLVKVAERLNLLVLERDSVCRLGGDEFAILLTELASENDVVYMAEKIMKSLAESYMINQRELIITPSIGISRCPLDGNDIQTLLKKSDVAMYKAKTSGRNTYRFYSKEDDKKASELLSLEFDMRKMLARDKSQLFLLYQPKVDIFNGKFSCVEALVRWEHPELGVISPAQFIPLLEETGLIIEVGEWVLREACLFASRQTDTDCEIKVAVNLSPRQLRQKEIVNTIKNILKETGCKPQCLELEMTESALVDDIEYTKLLLDEIAEMGVSLAIDDFGTGYSSMNYLKNLPFSTLKIDRSFISDAPNVEQDRAIVTTIAQLAKNLHMGVVAEGVETIEQFNLIKQILGESGINQIQGYLFSKPIKEDELLGTYGNIMKIWREMKNNK